MQLVYVRAPLKTPVYRITVASLPWIIDGSDGDFTCDADIQWHSRTNDRRLTKHQRRMT